VWQYTAVIPLEIEIAMKNGPSNPTEMVLKGIEAAGKWDFQTALDWSLQAAEAGSRMGAYDAARMYERGIGVTPDRRKAIELYRQAARTGVLEAQARLKKLYGNDLKDAMIVFVASSLLCTIYNIYDLDNYFTVQNREWIGGIIAVIIVLPFFVSLGFVVDRTIRLALHGQTYHRFRDQPSAAKSTSSTSKVMVWPVVALASFFVIFYVGVAVMLLAAPNTEIAVWYDAFDRDDGVAERAAAKWVGKPVPPPQRVEHRLPSLEVIQAGCLGVIVVALAAFRLTTKRRQLRPVMWVAGVLAAFGLATLPYQHEAGMTALAASIGGTALTVCLLCLILRMRAAWRTSERAEPVSTEPAP
jgi:hypothetical protein